MARLAWALRVLLLLGATLVANTARADNTTVLTQYLENLRSYSASFEQQRFDETGELLETAKGDCSIERPGRFRWNYREPYQQIIVSDGVRLWIYDEDLAQVTVNQVTADAPGTPAELLSAQFDITTRYTVTYRGLIEGYEWYRLLPKDAKSQFQEVELGFAEREIKAMRLKDNLGQTTLLHFDTVKRNAPMTQTLFQFTAPAGVDVVEGGAP